MPWAPVQVDRVPSVGLYPITRRPPFTRSPDDRRSFEGVATTHRIPTADKARANPNPVGPGRSPVDTHGLGPTGREQPDTDDGRLLVNGPIVLFPD